ncbi:MAG: hypothetical protein ACREWG_15290 [Gammaproteobacteria bacterium]
MAQRIVGRLPAPAPRIDLYHHRTAVLKITLCLMALPTFGGVMAAPLSLDDQGQAVGAQVGSAAGTNAVIINGRIDDLRSDAVGGGGSLNFVHTTPSGNTVLAGLAGFDVGESRWGFGTLGGAFRPRPPLTLQGEINYGSGHGEQGGFSYFIGKGGFHYELLAKRLYLKFEDQYFNIDDTQGHLLRGGVLVQVTSTLTADFDYAESVSGNLNTRFILGRLDFYSQWGRFLAGVATGRATPEIFDGVVRREADPQDTLEVFAGIAIPISRYEITLAVSHLDLEATSRTPLTLSIKYSF